VADVHNQMRAYAALLRGVARAVGEVAGSPDFSGIERFGETLTPTLNPWDRLEWALPRGEVVFAREITSPAVVARFAAVEFVNPTGSGTLAVIWGNTIVAAGTNIEVAIDTGGVIGANPVTRRGVAVDGRYKTLGESSQCTATQSDLAAGAVFRQHQEANNIIRMPVMEGYVIPPGSKLFYIGTVVNQAFSLQLRWSERRLLPNESEP